MEKGSPGGTISSSVGMAENDGGGNGEAWLAGLELAERLPRKMGPGGTMMSSSAKDWGFGGVLVAFPDGSIVFFRILIVAPVQLLDEVRICESPLENSSG
jgi:hypothetical protein